LARAWRLPANFGLSAAYHHDEGSTNPQIELVQLACRLADSFMFLSIARRDVDKPAETIAKYAPERLQDYVNGELKTVQEAVDLAIKTLDF
jgi:HD-like signal output (HDOD) protein